MLKLIIYYLFFTCVFKVYSQEKDYSISSEETVILENKLHEIIDSNGQSFIKLFLVNSIDTLSSCIVMSSNYLNEIINSDTNIFEEIDLKDQYKKYLMSDTIYLQCWGGASHHSPLKMVHLELPKRTIIVTSISGEDNIKVLISFIKKYLVGARKNLLLDYIIDFKLMINSTSSKVNSKLNRNEWLYYYQPNDSIPRGNTQDILE